MAGWRQIRSNDWKNVARKHAKNLTKNPSLSKKVVYDGNDSQKYDDMTMRPSDWTVLPQEYTHLQMIRSNQIHPLMNLDGNIVNVAEIKALYECEQESKRFDLVFKSRLERTGREKPSQDSRKKIGMEERDRRDHATLHKAIPASGQQGKIIYECWLADRKEREKAIGQDEAFRRFLYDLVLDDKFEPAACMGYLAMDTTTVHLCKLEQMRLRQCDTCLKDLASQYKVELVDDKQLLVVGVPMPFKSHASRLLGVMHFSRQKTSYLTKAGADDLCLMHHGLSYDKLRAADLDQETVKSNNDQFNVTTIVAEEIIRLQTAETIWSHVGVNANSDEFWGGVAAWLKDHPTLERFDRPWRPFLDAAMVTELAGQYWRKLLWDMYARKTNGEALRQYRIVQVRELDKLLPSECGKHPLHAETIEAHDVDEISYLNHGKSATEAQQDLPALIDVRLATYLTRSAVLVNIIGCYSICFIQVIVDLVAIVSPHQERGVMQDPKQRLSSFLGIFHSCLTASCPLPSGLQSIKQLQDIPRGFAEALADQALHDIAHGPLYDAVAAWAGDEQVFVDFPLTTEALSTAAMPEFLQCLMQFAGIGRFGPDGHYAPTMHHWGSVHWNCSSIEDTLMQMDA